MVPVDVTSRAWIVRSVLQMVVIRMVHTILLVRVSTLKRSSIFSLVLFSHTHIFVDRRAAAVVASAALSKKP